MALEGILARMGEQGLNVLVEGGGRLLFASDRQGLDPLHATAFTAPALLDGSDAALPAVGLAAAYLLIHAKVGRVFARTMTYAARKAFVEEGIEHAAVEFVRKLPPEHAQFSEALDVRAAKAVTPQAFIEELKRLGELSDTSNPVP